MTSDQVSELVRSVVAATLSATASDTKRILSTAEAAALASRSEDTIRDWIAQGRLRATRRGRTWAIRRDDLDVFLAGGKAVTAKTSKLLGSLGL